MQIKNNAKQYGFVAKFLHWLMFLLIAGLLTLGLIMTDMKMSPDTLKLYGLHKSFGFTVLVLVTLRLLWKFKNISPTLPVNMRAIEKLVARAAHWLLYALMFAMPLSGWMMSSAAGFPVSVFGLFVLPDLVTPDQELKHLLQETHELLGYALMVVAGLHILAALMHHFYHKNNVLRSMLPFAKVGEDAHR